MIFDYTESTTVDDIIEHILMRLNTDFAGGALQVPDFCSRKTDRGYNHAQEMEVRAKMYEHGVARQSDGEGQSEKTVELTAKGAQIYRQGGWKKYIDGFEESQIKTAKTERADKRWGRLEIIGPLVIGILGLGYGFYKDSSSDRKDQQIKALQDSLRIVNAEIQGISKEKTSNLPQLQSQKHKIDTVGYPTNRKK
jgi:hypothetical protein